MANFRVPRQLMEFFKHDKEIQRFFDSLQGILTGSTSSLDDLDQRSSVPALSRIDQVEKELDYLRKSITPGGGLKAQIEELNRKVRDLGNAENRSGLKAQIEEMKRQLNDIEGRVGTR